LNAGNLDEKKLMDKEETIIFAAHLS
jgi:hypothetical protein